MKVRTPRRRPTTTTLAALLENGSDRKFRKLLYGMFAINATFNVGLSHLGHLIGVTGPQYTMLRAITDLTSGHGVRPSVLAKALGVTKPFVTNECAKLIQAGLVHKRPDPNDSRSVLLTITEKGFKELTRLVPAIRRANDTLFRSLSRPEFQRLCETVDALVADSTLTLEALKEN